MLTQKRFNTRREDAMQHPIVETDSIYSADFFRWHEQMRPSYDAMAGWLFRRFQAAKSIIDFGCGCGYLLAEIRRLGQGRIKVLGIDGSKEAIKAAGQYLAEDELRHINLAEPFEPLGKFDIVICTEVAEHLEERFADRLVNTLVEHSRTRIVFTAATQGQTGQFHINCQPHWYWVEKFRRFGYLRQQQEESEAQIALMGDMLPCGWLLKNLMMLRRV